MRTLKIDYPSFFKKGLPCIKEDFGIFLITGYQGSGKTYFAVYNLERNFKNRVIKTNIKSLKSKTNRIVYFDKISDIYDDHALNCVYIIDELSKKYFKNSPLDPAFYSWLQQSRKHSRYVYMITQEYLQVPPWLRGVANTVYVTSKFPLVPVYRTDIGKPYLDENCEWQIDVFGSILYKRTKEISLLYDTNELINFL